MAGITVSACQGCGDARPGIPGESARRPPGTLRLTARGELAAVYDRSGTQMRHLLTMINTGAGWWRTVTQAGRDALPLRRHRSRDGAV